MEPITALVILALLFVAAGIATIVRAEDDPKTPWTKAYWKAHLKVFVYASIAAWLAMWTLGYDLTQPKDFLSVAAVAYLGFAFIKAAITRAQQDSAAKV